MRVEGTLAVDTAVNILLWSGNPLDEKSGLGRSDQPASYGSQAAHYAQHCYNSDVSFLWEKIDTLTPCNIETLEQIDTQFVRID